MRKLTRKGLKTKIDKRFKFFLGLLKPKVCVTCPRWNRSASTEVYWGHLITATKLSTRWDTQNVNWQCNPCNFLHEQYPEKYTEWFIDTYGYKEYQELNRRSNSQIQNYDIFYKEKLAEVEQAIAILQENKD